MGFVSLILICFIQSFFEYFSFGMASKRRFQYIFKNKLYISTFSLPKSATEHFSIPTVERVNAMFITMTHPNNEILLPKYTIRNIFIINLNKDIAENENYF